MSKYLMIVHLNHVLRFTLSECQGYNRFKWIVSAFCLCLSFEMYKNKPMHLTIIHVHKLKSTYFFLLLLLFLLLLFRFSLLFSTICCRFSTFNLSPLFVCWFSTIFCLFSAKFCS